MMMNPVKIILQIITSIMRYDIVFKEELRWLSNSKMACFTSEHSVRLAFVAFFAAVMIGIADKKVNNAMKA
jgi:hypothetical protein